MFELCGDETMPLDRLNEWFGEFAGLDFDAARAALRHAAAETAREAAINRKARARDPPMARPSYKNCALLGGGTRDPAADRYRRRRWILRDAETGRA